MTNANLVNRNHQYISAFLVLVIIAAGLATATATPAGASASLAATQNEWQIDDGPQLHGAWKGGNPASDGHGHGPAQYSNSSNYVFADSGKGHWAQWQMEDRKGTQDIQVHVPLKQACATVSYRIIVGSRHIDTVTIVQREILGWYSLGEFDTNGDRVRVQVH